MDTEWPSKDMEIRVRAERLEELQRKEEELTVALEEIVRLRREVDHRLDEMNLQARWTREAQEKVERFRVALRPFAEFARAFNAHPIRGIDDVLYGIHGGAGSPSGLGADLRLSDCRAALKALE